MLRHDALLGTHARALAGVPIEDILGANCIEVGFVPVVASDAATFFFMCAPIRMKQGTGRNGPE